MFRKLSMLYRRWRLSNLKPAQVTYNSSEEIICVKKSTVSLTIRCKFYKDIDATTSKTEYHISLSGDPLVVCNDVIEAIITALWNEVAGVDRDDHETKRYVTFSEVIVNANPTFFELRKVEVIPLTNPIPFKFRG
ncbi:MAG: hypothetical protein HFJ47_03390 [Clostridia bacterium]|nr:hypothetical protein [Clostridia bacterium]